MNNRLPILTVYPTSVALRQAQRRRLRSEGFFDGRGHITLSALLRECAVAALGNSPLRPITDLDRELAIVKAVSIFQTTRSGKRSAGILMELPPAALEETLAQLIDTVSPLADRAPDFLKLLTQDKGTPKNPELAALYSAYSDVCRSLHVADEATLNSAILSLLRGDPTQWPDLLRKVDTIAFIGVRWVAPFLDAVVQALSSQIGPERVIVRHILTDYEQEWWSESLLTQAGQLLFGDAQTLAGECEFQTSSTRSAIEHLTSLREGFAMQDRALAEKARVRTGFSCSVGTYGEIEDLARRIAWELQDRNPPLQPEDICLVTRTLGEASDAVIDVFTRFDIPFYFRRGVPVLAVPIIKTLIDFARFSATRERNLFCALLHSPWVNWSPWSPTSFDPIQLADDLLRSGVEPVINDPARVARRLSTYFLEQHRAATPDDARRYAAAAIDALQSASGKPNITTFREGFADLRKRYATFRLGILQEPSSQDPAMLRAYLLNAKAWETVNDALDSLEQHALVNHDEGPNVSWNEIVDLLNRALQNLTVSPTPPDESGVWILNPYDVAGLNFKLVIMAGLNAGTFPKPPLPSPLFPDAELRHFRAGLQQGGTIPAAALAEAKARNSQENLLFLTTLAAAREHLVFSYASHDETGQPLTPSVFFSTLWRLAGWPAWNPLPSLPPDGYDTWRLNQASPHLQDHWRRHLETRDNTPVIAPFKRRPFPGESYLGTVPLQLCRADDERWQRVAAMTGDQEKEETGIRVQDKPRPLASPDNLSTRAEHVAHGIRVERQRQAFFAQLNRTAVEHPHEAIDWSRQPGHGYAGVLDPTMWNQIKPNPKDGIRDFSPTQLEHLVVCPYKYYLQDVLKVEPLEPNDLEARPMDFGLAIHSILFEGFKLFQGYHPGSAIPGLAKLADANRPLFNAAWVVPSREGNWTLHHGPRCPDPAAYPLVRFPADAPAVLNFFDTLSSLMLDWATSGNAIWMLGAPEQIVIQRLRVQRAVRNVIRTALADDALPEHPDWEGCQRYPAFLEYTFNSQSTKAQAPSVELTDPAGSGKRLRLHGKIDRVDLVFDPDNTLRGAIVIDYKGSNKEQLTSDDLAEGIKTATDCQLPAYALATVAALQQPGTPDQKPQIPVVMHYLSYTQSHTKMVKQCQKRWIALGGTPDAPADLATAFTRSAFAALDRYERGDFAIAPQACEYCDMKACCRHAASLLSPEKDSAGGES